MKLFWTGIFVCAALLLGGLMFWQLRAGQDTVLPDAPPPPEPAPEGLPLARSDAPVFGPPPPTPPEAPKISREEVRFNRYDRDRDETISRIEMMSSRTKGFRALDKDGNNLLTFEEWAAGTSDRFRKADGDGNGRLTRTEFATTRPRTAVKPRCRC